MKRGLGSRQVLYVAQDIDRTAALMCYLQLSLLGCVGYVIVGNALTHPAVGKTKSPLLIAQVEDREIWVMPAFYDKTWMWRVQVGKVKYLTMTEESIKSAENFITVSTETNQRERKE